MRWKYDLKVPSRYVGCYGPYEKWLPSKTQRQTDSVTYPNRIPTRWIFLWFLNFLWFALVVRLWSRCNPVAKLFIYTYVSHHTGIQIKMKSNEKVQGKILIWHFRNSAAWKRKRRIQNDTNKNQKPIQQKLIPLNHLSVSRKWSHDRWNKLLYVQCSVTCSAMLPTFCICWMDVMGGFGRVVKISKFLSLENGNL